MVKAASPKKTELITLKICSIRIQNNHVIVTPHMVKAASPKKTELISLIGYTTIRDVNRRVQAGHVNIVSN